MAFYTVYEIFFKYNFILNKKLYVFKKKKIKVRRNIILYNKQTAIKLIHLHYNI